MNCDHEDTTYVCACFNAELDEDAMFLERAIACHDFAIALRA